MKKFVIPSCFRSIMLLLLVILITYVLILSNSLRNREQKKIIFGWPGTTFTDSGNELVFVQGSLVGSDVWRMVYSGMLPDTTNNSTMISCNKVEMKCITYIINQVGDNQISDLPIPSTFSVLSWGDYMITATDGGDNISCTKTIVNIDRKNKIVEWIQEPFDHTSIHCVVTNNHVYKWMINKPDN